MTTNLAKCPECHKWSEVAWDSSLPPGGFWWKDSGCCPKCGATVLVESECDFRDVEITVDVVTDLLSEIDVLRTFADGVRSISSSYSDYYRCSNESMNIVCTLVDGLGIARNGGSK